MTKHLVERASPLCHFGSLYKLSVTKCAFSAYDDRPLAIRLLFHDLVSNSGTQVVQNVINPTMVIIVAGWPYLLNNLLLVKIGFSFSKKIVFLIVHPLKKYTFCC